MLRIIGAIPSLVLGILAVALLQTPVFAQDGVTGSFTVQLTISNVSASDIGISSAAITWETNSDATSQVFFDTLQHESTDDYPYHKENLSEMATYHSLVLSGLSSSTTYHFRVRSVVTVGEIVYTAVSQDYTFRTKRRRVSTNPIHTYDPTPPPSPSPLPEPTVTPSPTPIVEPVPALTTAPTPSPTAGPATPAPSATAGPVTGPGPEPT
ncbi:MAG: fibronectin type III domain-containing protein, partial [Dehalococcoidales bacterium]|nr:fibronectin type III domain-containing protein [Dehalococcoidales bacterium]